MKSEIEILKKAIERIDNVLERNEIGIIAKSELNYAKGLLEGMILVKTDIEDLFDKK